MANFAKEQKTSANTQTNFNRSEEIAYWAKKYNVEPVIFQQIFQETGYSVSKTLAIINKKNN